MTHPTTALRAALLAAVTLLTATPAHAVPAPATPAHAVPGRHAPGDHLYLTLTPGDAHAHATGTADRTLLLCDPPRGHVRADRACAELDGAGGDIDRIPSRDTFCPMVYAPVTARADGRWGGRRVTYERTFPNRCVLGARTGAVFAFTDDRPGPDGRPLPDRR
ncbi:hypothetical protein QFZ63_002225 [Streptomyces sp. B3I7]|uniref:SSI family serine proteinase inhibitor n=1 Tax=unclassified Streptomyces TaxID=2593676 RepID=UPI00278436A4|nr:MULTISPECIES: SSI family serine proteinase inhibitor [unclassified Streptomyces]MDQ0789885.1 hypothetical protein [Streptomyces sp. B3I8]MDQ0810511.1 hypothetical protein [Streptomyces sp. B3I7]